MEQLAEEESKAAEDEEEPDLDEEAVAALLKDNA